MFLARLKTFFGDRERPRLTALEIVKYVGPGLLVTVGFIDPGNWASNLAAGSHYGYGLLWLVTLSTIMLVLLQHNAAHLGIATGLCLSEAATVHLKKAVSRPLLASALLAAMATALAEILGAAVALNLLLGLPIPAGAILSAAVVSWMLFASTYRRIEKIIIGFVSLVGLSFVFELALVHVDWPRAAVGWVVPRISEGAMPIAMSVLGAVVMPHNLFLHSEIVQSRQWNLADAAVRERQLKYGFLDTLFSMIVGFAINSAMILLAAATFHDAGVRVTDLGQAHEMLEPLLGKGAAAMFGVALLLAGIASALTAGMAGGSILAGVFKEPYDIRDWHSRLGAGLTLFTAAVAVCFVGDPLRILILSQMCLSIQLPWTIFLQIRLTSSRKVMGEHVNTRLHTATLLLVGGVVSALNVMLLLSYLT
ncbi:MAG: Nramp family divalent metal transporter [Deltaproteobacteria bacterium]|nr:Nramp family divalent metal transporter [Deltaproteobacteria bacterium]